MNMMRYERDYSNGHREYWRQIIEAVRHEEDLASDTESGLPPDIDLESLSLKELDRLTAPEA